MRIKRIGITAQPNYALCIMNYELSITAQPNYEL